MKAVKCSVSEKRTAIHFVLESTHYLYVCDRRLISDKLSKKKKKNEKKAKTKKEKNSREYHSASLNILAHIVVNPVVCGVLLNPGFLKRGGGPGCIFE